jgi:SAM-dependent methyltransferase
VLRCAAVTEQDLQGVVDRYLSGEISGPVTVMELLLKTADADAVALAVARLRGPPGPLRELQRLVAEHAAGCSTITEMLRAGLDSPETAPSVEQGIARARRLFDDSVTRSEESSVALYSLGSPALLAAATDEAVGVLEGWGVLSAGRDALEIGCGIGRFLPPLAGRLRSLIGIDVSAGMIAAARRRAGQLANVRLLQTSGRDLADFDDGAFDLVYSIDAFPYLVLAGRELVATHLREAARVLRPGGDLVVFNYAYGRARDADARELDALGRAAGLRTLRGDEAPFRLWNAVAFHLRRP